MDDKLKAKVQALQLNTAGLLKLLGQDKQRFWEILKGITTPAEYRLVAAQIDAMNAAMKQAQTNLKGIETAVAKIR